jgi:archaellum component FlaF (FlaF/FlaG flagellin family)
MLLICCGLLFAACNQSSTTPTTPPSNPCGGILTVSNEFIEININGTTLKSETLQSNGINISPITCVFNTDTSLSRTAQIMGSTTTCPTNLTMINNGSFVLVVSKHLNPKDPLGSYIYGGHGGISDWSNINNKIDYTIPQDSLRIDINNCTADYVSGTISGTAIESNTNIKYPFTGIFHNAHRSGF